MNALVLLLAVGLLASANAQDCQQVNTVYVEGSSLNINTDLADCQARCNASSTCNFYTWNTKTKGCGLRNFPVGGYLDAPDQVTGTPFTSAVIQNAVLVSAVKKGLTQNWCILACQADSQCQSWTWYFAGVATGACFLNYERPLVSLVTPGAPLFVSGLRSCLPTCQGSTTPTTTTPTTTTTTTASGPVLVIKRGQFGNQRSFFNRSWTESEQGYGDPTKDYFIGLKTLSSLTASGNWRANLTADNRNYSWSTFKVGSAATNYTLTVGGFWAGQPANLDALAYHNGSKFSTYDRDNDNGDYNCAGSFGGPNWFNNCAVTCLLCPTPFYGGFPALNNTTLTLTRI